MKASGKTNSKREKSKQKDAVSPPTKLQSKAVISRIGFLRKTSVGTIVCVVIHMRMLRKRHL